MAEEGIQTAGPVPTMPGRRRPRSSRLPLVIASAILALLVIAALWSVLRPADLDEPWRIDYPGVTVVRGGDDYKSEGKRILRLIVRVDKPVVSADDGTRYLAELVRQTRTVYHYYLVKMLNRDDVHVLDLVAGSDETWSVFATDRYAAQSGLLAEPPDVLPEAIIDESENVATERRPWEFDWPGVHWLSGKASTDEEGKEHLRVTVAFDAEPTKNSDVDAFLRELAKRQKDHFAGFRVKVFNRRGVQTWDARLDTTTAGGTVVIPY